MRKKLAVLPSLLLLSLVAGCGGQGPEGGGNASYTGEDQSGPPRASVYCPAVEQRVSPQDCEDLTRADAEVRPGAAAFNVPDPMRRGQTFEVHLVIDRRSPKEIRIIEGPRQGAPGDATGNVADSDPGASNTASAETGAQENAAASAGEASAPTPGQIVDPLEGRAERFFPPVGRYMRAELVGEGFDIAPKTAASQEIPLGASADWIWSVTARKGGVHALTLVTVVEGVTGGRRFVLARSPRVRTVTVEVRLSDRIWDVLTGAPAWIKAVTAVVAAVTGLLTALYAVPWRRRRKAARQASAPDETGPGGGEE
ncbi:MAG TPA: hypothetical protein VGD66_05225 [Allosphingosinicella sp.]|jgi:hypothetical protein